MNGQENSHYVERERQHNREQNLAELERLHDQAEEMQQELAAGRLSTAAKIDLQEQFLNTNKAITIVRNSLRALTDRDAILIDEGHVGPISAEVTDPLAYWLNENQIRVKELQELREEYSSYQEKDLSDDERVRATKLKADIERLEQEAEYALGKYFESA
jgi:hypothetical protein